MRLSSDLVCATGVPSVYRTLLEVFTSNRPTRPLLKALPLHKYVSIDQIEKVRARQLVGIAGTQRTMDAMHKEVVGLSSASRKKAVESHNDKTHVQVANFHVGDFVLVRRAQPKGHKLQFVWRGPRRIKEVKSEWVYVIEDVLRSRLETVHAARLLFYRGDMVDKEVDPILMSYIEHSDSTYQEAKALRGIRQVNGSVEIQVEWEGLSDQIDRSWGTLRRVFEDLPGLLHDFLYTAADRELKKRALRLCSFQ